MITEIMTKEVFLDLINKLIGKNEIVIFTNRLENIKILAHKKIIYAKSYNAIYPSNIFKDDKSIADLLNSKLTGLIICDTKILSEKLQEQYNEIKKNEEEKCMKQ